LGSHLAALIHRFGTYAAAALVFGLGVKMLYEAWKQHPGEVSEAAEHAIERALHVKPKDPTRGWSLLGLSVATSLDALVVGISLALHEGSKQPGIWRASAIIGVVAAGMSLAGVLLGQHVGRAVGRPAEFLGAVVLMGLGVSFLFV